MLAIVLLILFSYRFQTVSTNANGSCDTQFIEFARDRLTQREKIMTPRDPQKMLFFMHIPRTAGLYEKHMELFFSSRQLGQLLMPKDCNPAGRTFHSCFLRLAFPPSKRCAKSYDVLRLDVR